MTKDLLSRHINNVRRIQARLGTYPKGKPGAGGVFNLLQQQPFFVLLEKLNPKINLCDFHPFAEQISFDFSRFDQQQKPIELPVLPEQINPLSKRSSNTATDRDPCLENYSLHQHISQLVADIVQITSNSAHHFADTPPTINIDKVSNPPPTLQSVKAKNSS